MISHKHKCIFIHIPKTAGMSINAFFHPGVNFHFKNPDYERLFGWCPKRKIHMQHGTPKELLETELISKNIWNSYYKFSFVRNPWDRAYSDFCWMKDWAHIKGSFKEYINAEGEFKNVLTDNSSWNFLGDHLYSQTDFFEIPNGYDKINFLGRFENFEEDIQRILKELKINEKFQIKSNTSKRVKDYSIFYTESNKRRVQKKFIEDIERFNYSFKDKRRGIDKLKKYL